MYWQKIDLSNDVSFMKIVRVVCDCRPERQYLMNTPRIYIYCSNIRLIQLLTMDFKQKRRPFIHIIFEAAVISLT